MGAIIALSTLLAMVVFAFFYVKITEIDTKRPAH